MKRNCTLCGLGAKFTLTLIGLSTLIQSLIFIGLSATAIMVHNCSIDMASSAFLYLWYFIYFRDAVCGPDQLGLLINNLPDGAVLPNFPDVTAVSSRTNIIAIVYLTLSLLWLISSMLLLTSTYVSCLGKTGFYMFIMPWVVITIANILLDIAAAIFFIFDLTNSFSIESLLSWLGANSSIPNLDSLVSVFVLTIPSIVMISIALRGLFLLILNIFSVCIVFSTGLFMIEEIHSRRTSINHQQAVDVQTHFAETRYNSQPQQEIMVSGLVNNAQSNFQYQNDGFVNDNNQFNGYYTPSDNHNQPTQRSSEPYLNLDNKNVTITSEKLKGGDDKSLESNGSSGLGRSQSSSLERPNSQLNKRKPPIPPKKPVYPNVNSRYSAPPAVASEERSSRSNIVPPEELRSQLPWSYFQSRDQIVTSSNLVHMEDKADHPPIPVPDYTLHFPKKERSSVKY